MELIYYKLLHKLIAGRNQKAERQKSTEKGQKT